MLQIIKINNQKYNVISVFESILELSSDQIKNIKRNCNYVIKHGNSYLSCNEIQDIEFEEIKKD